MDLKNAKTIITSREVCKEEGKYRGKVTSVSPYQDKYIVNLNRMTNYHLEESKKFLKEGIETGDESLFQKAVNQNLTIFVRESDYQPTKGEIIEFVLENVTSKKSGITGLFVTSYNPLKVNKSFTINLDDISEEIPEEGSEEVKEEIKPLVGAKK